MQGAMAVENEKLFKSYFNLEWYSIDFVQCSNSWQQSHLWNI